MAFPSDFTARRAPYGLAAMLSAPAMIIFISSNFVNVGNLAFNVIFSRLMGPELFGVLAYLLTVKLALLGMMGAVQMAVSQLVAYAPETERHRIERGLSRFNLMLPVGLVLLGLPLTACLALIHFEDARIGIPAPHLFLILVLSMPFAASLSVLRGVAFGRLQTARIVLSSSFEMLTRLILALLAWSVGLGIEGVVAAVGLSIIVGWTVLLDLLPWRKIRSGRTTSVTKKIAITATPFAVLQIAQVLALDGDIFLATALLPAGEAGLIAALSLFQRIQFFACFALAAVLLPSVVNAIRENTGLRPALLPITALFISVSTIFLGLVAAIPSHLVGALVGIEYLAAASGLWLAAISAVAFTLSFLIATFLIALNDRTGVVITIVAAVIQLVLFYGSAPEHFTDLLMIKAVTQLSAAVVLLLYAARKRGDRPQFVPPLTFKS